MMCARLWQRNNVSAAEAELQTYRAQQGVTPDYVEALSWMARASLASHQLDQADKYAKQTESLSRQTVGQTRAGCGAALADCSRSGA